jgi:hypothetical protein
MIDDQVHDLDEDSELEDDRDFERRVARRMPGGDVEVVLQDLRDMVDQARPAPLSTAIKVDRDVLLDLVDQAIARLPGDLREARWLLKERDEFLERTHREADEILAAARGQAERMVQRSEIMHSAEAKARRIVEVARSDAARLRNECDDYCDQRLAQLETVLERTLGVVANGRAKLRGPMPDLDEDDELEDDDEGSTSPFFDQDRV